jgi:hypothetical protein
MAREFIPKEKIEDKTVLLLEACRDCCWKTVQPPVPVAEILECHLEFELEFEDLKAKYKSSDILAATYLESKLVIVDESLDPEEYPDMEGRYHFTLAHEIGHWSLHRKYFISETPDMFGDAQPSTICRSSFKDPREYQADSFAAYLLMPGDLFKETWNSLFPGKGPLNVYEELDEKRKIFGLTEKDSPPNCDLSRKLASIYKVSAQAMQIRLCELKLLEIDPPEKTLF